MNVNGSLSASKSRRSVSAELTPTMKADLVTTPVRGRESSVEAGKIASEEAAGEDSGFPSVDSSFSTPTGIHAAAAFAASTTSQDHNATSIATPTGHVAYDPGQEGMSPMTPYYMSLGAKLVQMTCPPKQTRKGLFDEEQGNVGFPLSGRIEDQGDKEARKRLEAARRKTMNWRPRVGSPLGR